MHGIIPNQLYTPDEAAQLLGLKSKRRTKTLGAVRPSELPVVWVGPNGGVKRYLGQDLVSYIEKRRKAA